jgi:fibronectin-binding autotransporter adhesin
MSRRKRPRRRLVHEALDKRQLLHADPFLGWQNPDNPLDVDADQAVTPRDALLIATALDSRGGMSLRDLASELPLWYPDVNGDRAVSDADFDTIAEFLNRPGDPGAASYEPVAQLLGEGEMSGSGSGSGGGEMSGSGSGSGGGSGSGSGSGSGGGSGSGSMSGSGSGYLEIDSSASASEESGSVSVGVTFRGSAIGGFTVTYDTIAGTARDSGTFPYGADFSPVTAGTLSFSGTDGEVKYIVIDIVDDAIVELDEQFQIVLGEIDDGTGTPPAGLMIESDTCDVTIVNADESIVQISPPTSSDLENLLASAPLEFTVSLSNPVDAAVTLDFAPRDGTATAADGDYVAESGTITFLAGITGSPQFNPIWTRPRVTINADNKVEEDEWMAVDFTNLTVAGARNVQFEPNPDGSVPSFGSRSVNIKNDDHATVSLIVLDGVAIDAPGETLKFAAKLDKQVDVPITVVLATMAGTASAADGDYSAIPVPSSLSFAGNAGEQVTFEINVLADSLVELDETMSVYIASIQSSGRSVQVGTPAAVQGTISNVDEGKITIGDASVNEPAWPQTTSMTFTVSISNPVDFPVTIPYHTVAVSAMAGADFVHVPIGTATVTIPAFQTSAQIDITINSDNANGEPNETFWVVLDDPTAGGRTPISVHDDTGVGTIVDPW